MSRRSRRGAYGLNPTDVPIAPGAPCSYYGAIAFIGRGIESETGRPVVDASIEVLSAGDERTGGAHFSDAAGRFRIDLSAGHHSFLISRLGYVTQRIDDVAVRAGGVTELVVSLPFRALIMQPVVISASRRDASPALDGSMSASIVGRERVRERIAVTAADHVRVLPGMDVAETGIQQRSVGRGGSSGSARAR